MFCQCLLHPNSSGPSLNDAARLNSQTQQKQKQKQKQKAESKSKQKQKK